MENTSSGITGQVTTPSVSQVQTEMPHAQEGGVVAESEIVENEAIQILRKEEIQESESTRMFADKVFDTALERGEDEAFEMLASDDEPKEDEEEPSVVAEAADESLDAEVLVDEKKPEGMDVKAAELQSQVDYLLSENKDLVKRVGKLEVDRENAAASLAAILEELKRILEEERKKKEGSDNALVLMLQFMARLVEMMLDATVNEIETTASAGKRPVEKQAA